MSLSTLAVRRGVTFSMAYLILVGFGMFSLSRLQLDLWPDITFPMLLVITQYTGASPEDVETLLSRPIEGAVASVKGVETIASDSKRGLSVVTVEFGWGRDMDQAETDVRRQLELIADYLPADAARPIVFVFDPSMQPVVFAAVRGPYPLDELRRLAEERITPRLERLDGIATAAVTGGMKREIHVTLDPVRVTAFGLDPAAVIGAVYQGNLQEPGGYIEQGSLDFTIQTEGKYRSPAEIGEVVVGVRTGARGPRPIRLVEVAKIEDDFAESRQIIEIDGQPGLMMMVRKQSGANTVKAARAVMEEFPKLEGDLGVEFGVIFNQAQFINVSLGNLSTTGMAGILISFLVLLLFLRNIRSALIVTTAIPLSVIATFFVMDQTGMTLNILSIAGLALAIGMLVDNAVVVLENIFRLREEGLGPWQAAGRGAKEVMTAVTASTLTTVSVFVPLLFVPGIAGAMFRDMAFTITFALSVSLVVAVTFVPLASSRLLGTPRATRLLERARRRQTFSRLRDVYGRQLDWTLRHRWVVALGLVLALGATVGAATRLPTDFMASGDSSFVEMTIETPVGNNVEEAHLVLNEAIALLEEVIPPEERRMIDLDAGVGEGISAVFQDGIHSGTVRVPLVPIKQRKRSQRQIEDAVRAAMRDLPGVKVRVGPRFNAFGGEGDIEILVEGHDLATSRRVGLDLQQELRALAEMSEVSFSMEDQKPEVRVRFDRHKLAVLGLSSGAVGQAIGTSFMGRVAGRYAEAGDEYDILVRYAREHRLDLGDLRRLPIVTPAGGVVPLGNIARVDEGLGPVTITRKDQQRVTRLNCTLKDEWLDGEGIAHPKDLGGAIERVDAVLAGYAWPDGFTYDIGGTAEDFKESFQALALAFLVAILLVYMVMASQFESLRQPFIILFSVPLAMIGVVVMFGLTKTALSVSALVGVIMLVGIAVNNGIVMVDAANQLRAKGLDRVAAIAQASRQRFRPVLLTSTTTILSMVPLALELGEGAESWSGMARAVIGGLTAATMLTLVVVPVMYTLFARKVLKVAQPEVV